MPRWWRSRVRPPWNAGEPEENIQARTRARRNTSLTTAGHPGPAAPSKESTMKLRTLSLVYSISTLAMAVFVLGAPYKL